MSASECLETKYALLLRAQEKIQKLQAGHAVCLNSPLSALSPEYVDILGVIRLGGLIGKAADDFLKGHTAPHCPCI